MKRFFRQGDFLPLLLNHSGSGSHCATTITANTTTTTATYQNNDLMHRLATSLNNENAVPHFSAYELKELFSALVEECQNDDKYLSSGIIIDRNPPRSESIDGPPRTKSTRFANNYDINAHSILRFAEQIIHQRYNNNNNNNNNSIAATSSTCESNHDDEFLGNELKRHFGMRDVLFRAEEDVLCLAFEMALNAIVQTTDCEDTGVGRSKSDETRVANVDNGRDDPKSDATSSSAAEDPTERPYRNSKGSSDPLSIGSANSDGAIPTALRIIDRVVLVDKRERATRRRLRRSNANSSIETNGSDRRKKYEHLLRPTKKRRHGSRGCRESRVGMSLEITDVKCIMEEKYPKQWKRLQQFRTKYELKLERASEMQQQQQSHHRDSFPKETNEGSSAMVKKPSNSVISPSADKKENNGPDSNFVIVRRKILTMDDISLSSSESEDETNDEPGSTQTHEHNRIDNTLSEKSPTSNSTLPRPESELPSSAAGTTPSSSPPPETVSPYDELDRETCELRVALLDMPPAESSSTEVVRHTVEEIGTLLRRYGEAGGAGGISRCGDIFAGGSRAVAAVVVVVVGGDAATAKGEQSKGRSNNNRFPLNDAAVSSLAKAFLTDATGSLRAKAFLRSFVLPLMIDMNPIARAVASGCADDVGDRKKGSKGKPASRVLTSLLTSLARDRPAECVESVVVPTLCLKKYIPSAPLALEASFEPTRFQCELASRLLRGTDALSIPAVALLVEEVLPIIDEVTTTAGDAVPTRGGMEWTENTMPVLTACLNRQPNLPDAAVEKLADEISYCLSPTSPRSMIKSMKFSTLFHALVSKYGPQLKSAGRVEPLKSSATRLKTFMSKTIGLSLKKLS
eukprot:CAMPEP_0201659760 /NCGR_PEP_ID=MMETSP0494-20130426/2534_1 /ASSEMBLY_ACC=CAM_ASM_000839 /TAXON_ID=420259 /ORGANISM="Thalassiosira gravida, Strain GMp14c1" /LENGTH=856 /DNA_ID=CAMNT_0048137391 /DNA_START=286 /DNA_END=2856 /DNA_ORIENTATION=-